MKIQDEIIRYIKRNRVSTTEVADSLGKSGVLSSVLPLTPEQFKVGRVRCVFTANNSNYSLHEQIKQVEEGDIVILFTHNCDGRGPIGDLIAKFILLYKGAEAIVVDGLVRDAASLKRERYSVWCKGVSPLGCFNTPAPPFPEDKEKKIREELDGGVAVCDDGGVTIIPAAKLNSVMLERLSKVELQEDIWFYCLDTLKWDTKRIVCEKDYLNQPDLLPSSYREKLVNLEVPLDSQ